MLYGYRTRSAAAAAAARAAGGFAGGLCAAKAKAASVGHACSGARCAAGWWWWWAGDQLSVCDWEGYCDLPYAYAVYAVGYWMDGWQRAPRAAGRGEKQKAGAAGAAGAYRY